MPDQWRECDFAEPPSQSPCRGKQWRKCYGELRPTQGRCGRGAGDKWVYVYPECCAICRIPALVESSMEVIRSCARRFTPEENATLSELLAGCDCDQRAECLHYMALAALNLAKDGEALCPDCGQSRDGCS